MSDPLAVFDVAGGVVIGVLALIFIVWLLTPDCDRLRLDASPPPRSRPRHRSQSALSRASEALERVTDGNAGLLPRNAVDPEVTPAAQVLDPPAAVTSEAPEPLFSDWSTGEFAALVLDDRGQQ